MTGMPDPTCAVIGAGPFGMALVAASWGIRDLSAGLALAQWWGHRPVHSAAGPGAEVSA